MQMLRLQYKETPTQRVWRRGLLMHDGPGALSNMRKTAQALMIQEGWHAWRAVQEPSGRIAYSGETNKGE